MKTKKGFTLIELLAVIVILAIIMVIAVPQILNVIENSRKSAAISSAQLYIRAIEYNNKFADMKPTEYTKITSGDVSGINVSIKGEGPTSGSVTINENGKVSSASLCIQGYTVNYDGASATIGGKCSSTPAVAYNPGDVVYFDPVTENQCDSTTFSVDAIKNNTSTCYKWRVITVGDTTSSSNITLQLDHNLINKDRWSTGTNATTGPNNILTSLASATSTWSRVPVLNYTYDTTGASKNYGIMTCVNGICSKQGTETVIAGTSENPVRARLITGEELKDIVVNAGAANNSKAGLWSLASTPSDTYYFSNSNYIIGTATSGTGSTSLSWLVENTESDSNSGASANSYDLNNSGYWTLSTISNYPYSGDVVWNVRSSGLLEYRSVSLTSVAGARPVITISKSLIN